MPDWTGYIRERFSPTHGSPEREAEIVEELAQQLSEAYEEALARGLDEQDAFRTAQRHVADWAALSQELADAGALPRA